MSQLKTYLPIFDSKSISLDFKPDVAADTFIFYFIPRLILTISKTDLLFYPSTYTYDIKT